MGLFDPQATVTPTPESVPQVEPNPLAMAAGSLINSFGQALSDTSKQGSGGSSDKNAVWAEINDNLDTAAQFRREGEFDKAAQLEVNITRYATNNGVTVGNSQWNSNYEALTGTPAWQQGQTPEGALQMQAMNDTEGWAAAWATTYVDHRGKELSQEQREQAALEVYQSRQVSEAQKVRTLEDWESGGDAKELAALREELKPIIGTIEEAKELDMEIGLNEIVSAEGRLSTIRRETQARLTDLGIPPEQISEFLDNNLGTLESEIEWAKKVTNWDAAGEGIKARFLSEVQGEIRALPKQQQMLVMGMMTSSDGIMDAIVALQGMDDEASAELLKSMVGGIKIAYGAGGTSLGGGSGGTNADAGREGANNVSITVDPSTGQPTVSSPEYDLGPEFEGMTPEMAFEIASENSRLLKSGVMTESSMKEQTDLMIAQGLAISTAAPRDGSGRYFSAQDIGALYDGRTEQLVKQIGQANPEDGYAVSVVHFNALGNQRIQAQTELNEMVERDRRFSQIRDENGNTVGFSLNSVQVERVGREAGQKEALSWMKENGGFDKVLFDRTFDGRMPPEGMDPKTFFGVKAIRSQMGLTGAADPRDSFNEALDSMQMIDNRRNAFGAMVLEYGKFTGKFEEPEGSVKTMTLNDPAVGTGGAANIMGRYGYDAQALEVGSGLPEGYLNSIIMIESGGNPLAVSPTGATGLFQFVQGTWAEYGSGDRKDPTANIEAGVKLSQNNARGLERSLGRPPVGWELYVAHQQGLGGAKALLSNPDMNVIDAMVAGGIKRETATRNVSVNNGDINGTAAQFLQKWQKRYAEASGIPPAATDITSIAGDAIDAADASLAPESSPTPQARPEAPSGAPEASPRPQARPVNPEVEKLFEVGGNGFSAEEAKAASEANPDLKNALSFLTADEANAVILRLVGGE